MRIVFLPFIHEQALIFYHDYFRHGTKRELFFGFLIILDSEDPGTR